MCARNLENIFIILLHTNELLIHLFLNNNLTIQLRISVKESN